MNPLGGIRRKLRDKVNEKHLWLRYNTEEKNHKYQGIKEKKLLKLCWEEKRKNIVIVLYSKLPYKGANLRIRLP